MELLCVSYAWRGDGPGTILLILGSIIEHNPSPGIILHKSRFLSAPPLASIDCSFHGQFPPELPPGSHHLREGCPVFAEENATTECTWLIPLLLRTGFLFTKPFRH